MNNTNTITMQEVRRDVPGFLKRIASGQRLTVIYHSKPLVTVANADIDTASTTNMQSFLDAAAKARASATSQPDPNKSFKELYAEDMAHKYGIS